jgi:hypothetical protein
MNVAVDAVRLTPLISTGKWPGNRGWFDVGQTIDGAYAMRLFCGPKLSKPLI